MNESEGWVAKEIAPIEGLPAAPSLPAAPLSSRLGLFGRRSYGEPAKREVAL